MAGYASTTQSHPQLTLERSRLRVPSRAFSLRTAIIVFVGLLILFRWLHLILALQLASTGRQIQIATQELQKAERYNATLVRQISEAEAPANLASRAARQGYGPGKLLYLRTDLPIGRPAIGGEQHWTSDRVDADLTGEATSMTPWDALSPGIGGSAQVRTDP
jgi:cell division protein FtsB